MRGGSQPGQGRGLNGLVVVIGMALVAASYFVLRLLGQWAENDTAVFSRVIRDVAAAGSLTGPNAYPHGYGFPTWATVFMEITGLDVNAALLQSLPFVGPLLAAVAGFALFRRLLPNHRSAALATVLLFLTPELLFSLARGNHEKLTLSLTLFAMLALLAAFLEYFESRRWHAVAAWIAVYYLTAFGMVSMNVFFGSSFIAASTFALGFALAAAWMTGSSGGTIMAIARRLALPVLTSWLLVALVMFFVYPPSGNVVRLFGTALERIQALLLTLTPESDPYQVTQTDWASPLAFQILSSFRWVMFLGSFAFWVYAAASLLRRPQAASLRGLYLVALYGAFGLQLTSALIVDLLGLQAGTNLQVRIYVYFVLVAAPMFALALERVRTVVGATWTTRLMDVVVPAGLAAFALLSLAKATLDPMVSNRWLSFNNQEVAAIRFWDERHEYDAMWIGPEARLRNAYSISFDDGGTQGNYFDVFEPDAISSKALWSDSIAAEVAAWGIAPPVLVVGNRVYDNGAMHIAGRVPSTPFQR